MSADCMAAGEEKVLVENILALTVGSDEWPSAVHTLEHWPFFCVVPDVYG